MPVVYLGLGSNVGDRRDNLRKALALLKAQGIKTVRISPVVETPALLPPASPADWNLPFLNLVIEGVADGTPRQWRQTIKRIEQRIGGRDGGSSWAPRAMDIDMLLWDDEVIDDGVVTLPYKNMQQRNFIISPLLSLRPELVLPGLGAKTVLEWSRSLRHHVPLWMGILNLTPDSFSDANLFTSWSAIEPHIDAMVEAGVHIIDIGAESTRPGATAISAAVEWARLQPVLARLQDKFHADPLRPLFSIDTYHAEVAAKALAQGADIINDVGGLTDPEMVALARASGKDWIAMHHLTVPADRAVTLPVASDPYSEVALWLERRLQDWDSAGLDVNRIVFDPGIGFGKDGLQSLMLLRAAARFRQYGLRLLIGHSRKSFLKNLSPRSRAEKDLATIGASLYLCQQGVDIIRVHDVPAHIAAYRGWAHCQAGNIFTTESG